MIMVFYRLPDGSPCPYPTNKEIAVRKLSRRYDDGERCRDCNHTSLKFTASDECVWCAQQKSVVLSAMVAHGPENCLHWIDGRPAYQFHDRLVDLPDGWYAELMTLYVEALTSQTSPAGEPCDRYGHPRLTAGDGKCHTCRVYASPRQDAIDEGRTTYVPVDPCRRCGTYAPRSVANGRCQGCQEKAQRERQASPAAAIIDAAPDMIIDRATARDLGFVVYRTGKPCRRGHTGWRYVASGNCLDCRNHATDKVRN